MKKKVISFILCFIMSISLVEFNKVESKAEDSSIDYSDYYIKNYEEELEDEKYIVIDNDEDLKEMEEYMRNWENTVGNFENPVCEREYNYPYYISFIAKDTLTYENIKDILSEYDTKFLFGYTITDKYLKQNIKDYLDHTNHNFNGTQINNSILSSQFKGNDDELVELIKYLKYYSDGERYFRETIDSVEYNKLKRLINKKLYNGESKYSVRFKTDSDYKTAIKKLENNNIFITSCESSEVGKVAKNSIIITFPLLVFIDDNINYDRPDYEYILDDMKDVLNALKEYDFKNRIYLLDEERTRNYLLIIESINENDFSNIFSIIQNIEKEKNGIIIPYITGDNSSFNYNCNYSFYDYSNIDSNKFFKIGYKNSDKYVITKNADTFFNSLNENSEIYPVEDIELKTIYRLYNGRTGEHLFTSKKSEYDKLENKGWTKEGETFNGCNDKDAKGVYRVYNPNAKGGDHHYTMSQKEAENLVKKGWKWDNNGNPLFHAAGDKNVYRLYNKVDGRHHYTPKVKEKEKLVGLGWVDEGVAWQALD